MADNLTKKQRSYCMSRVNGRDTGLERVVRSELHKRGYRFRKHVKSMPGKPDIVFVRWKTAVFLDGDFWHGYRFPAWEKKMPKFWQKKIGETRRRDQRNFVKLKKMGWKVLRIWEHEIENDFNGVIDRIVMTIQE